MVVKNLKIPQPGKDTAAKAAMLEVMESAVYGAVLGAFVQGLQVSLALSLLSPLTRSQDHHESVDHGGKTPGHSELTS